MKLAVNAANGQLGTDISKEAIRQTEKVAEWIGQSGGMALTWRLTLNLSRFIN